MRRGSAHDRAPWYSHASAFVAFPSPLLEIRFMPKFDHHIFVCLNERPAGSPRGCCASKGAEAVKVAMKEEITKRGLKSRVRANEAGCLNQCALGVTVVVYPEQVWYRAVTVADVKELFDRHIEKGEIVERLRVPDELLNTPRAIGSK
jgi:(2Fe-2S) ferredoxin